MNLSSYLLRILISQYKLTLPGVDLLTKALNTNLDYRPLEGVSPEIT